MKVLIIRLSAIGDTVHCLPVAAAIKRRIPGAQVSWLVEPASAPLLQNNPAVDRVFIFPKKKWLSSLSKPWQWFSAATEFGAWCREIREQKFDVAIDFQGLLKSALCGLMSGAKYRLGFAHTREGAERLLTNRLDVGDYFFSEQHIVDLNLRLVDYLTQKVIPDFSGAATRTAARTATEAAPRPASDVEFPLPSVPPDSAQRIEEMLTAAYLTDQYPDKSMVRQAVLIPGTTWDTKIWDADKWCQLARQLIGEMGFRICLIGGTLEVGTNAEIANRLKKEYPPSMIADLTGGTSLLDLLALYERSDLVVGGDSGPLHLAAATNIPKVVGIFGSTPWRRNGPYGPKCTSISLEIWCQPCFSKRCPLSTIACLRDLSADHVFATVVRHLENS